MSFHFDPTTGNVTLHQGDTGSYTVTCARSSGADFGEDDRMLYSVESPSGELVMQRLYRLDREDLNGIADIEYHNADTQGWPAGVYSGELRVLLNAYWNIQDPPTGDVVDLLALYGGLALDGPVVDGDTVRTKDERFSVTILDVIGEV